MTANGTAEGASKLVWSPEEPGVIIIGKRNGVIEKWDTRIHNAAAAVIAVPVPCGGENVMDLEISPSHGLVLIAAGTKVGTRSIIRRPFE